MAKKIIVMFVFVSLFCYGVFLLLPEKQVKASATPAYTPTATEAAKTCKVNTGIAGGTVNLRTCAGTGCGVMDILTEGASLNIVTAGNWIQVTNKDGVTGWLNSMYCK